jgi:hypothetical protein
MVYHTVGEIFEAIDEVRCRTYQLVEGLSQEQACFRTQPDTWSVGDLAEHVCKSEEAIVKRIDKLLTQAESDGLPAGAMSEFSLDHLREGAAGKKFTAPETVRPTANGLLADVLAQMRRNRATLTAMRPRLEAVDVSDLTFNHPAFGPLNPYQWIVFTSMHERRHLEQMEAVISSPSFPEP